MPKILVVDDARFGRNAVKRAIPQYGFEVIEAENGIQALEQVEAHAPDIIFTDLLMPKMDGFELIRQLRSRGCNAKVCIVSADIQTSSHDLATDLGVADFLNKPFKPDQVLDVINRALSTVKGC
jgi:two-component system chemotaxis response regulator CheY